MKQILLVEDQNAAAALIRHYIRDISGEYNLATFASASEALTYAKHKPVDLFILDIQLLDYRGTELARQLRAMSEYRYTPILFTTELAGEELSAYREIKCYDFLVKPFTEEAFQAAFRSAIEMGARIQEAPAILRIEQKQFLFEYEIKSVPYIESFGKQVVIHSMPDGGTMVSDTISGYALSKLLELAGEGKLIQCHKSFLINPDWIWKIDKRNRLLYLKNCETAVPIGEKYQNQLLD